MKTTKTKHSQKENIENIIEKLNDNQRKNFKKFLGKSVLLELYNSLLENTEIAPSAQNTKRMKDLYLKLIEYLGLEIKKQEESWKVNLSQILDEVEGLYNLKLFSQAYIHLEKAKQIIDKQKSKFSRLEEMRKDFFILQRYKCLKDVIEWVTEYEKPIPHENFNLLMDEINTMMSILQFAHKDGQKEFDQYLSLNHSKIYTFKLLARLAQDAQDYNLADDYLKKSIENAEKIYYDKKDFFTLSGSTITFTNADEFYISRIEDVKMILLYIEYIWNYFQSNSQKDVTTFTYKLDSLSQFVNRQPNSYTQALFSFILVLFGEKLATFDNISFYNEYHQSIFQNENFPKYFFNAKQVESFSLRLELNQIVFLILSNNFKEADQLIETLLNQKKCNIDNYRDELKFLGLITHIEVGKKLHEKFYSFKLTDKTKQPFFNIVLAMLKECGSSDAGYRKYRTSIEQLQKAKNIVDKHNPLQNTILAWFDKYSFN